MDSSDSDSGGPARKRRKDFRKSEEGGGGANAEPKNWRAEKKEKKARAEKKLLRKLDEQNQNEEREEEGKKREKSAKMAKKEPVTNKDHQSQLKTESNQDQKEKEGRLYTVSIAVAGSIIDNAQSPPLKAYLAGQVARAAAIFRVDEVIVYDDTGGQGKPGCEQMARVLQFLECPQYLRKDLFPIHPDLQYAGLIAPLDIPHHLRKNEALPYREGVVSKKPMKDGKDYALINVGLDRDCRVDKKLPLGIRVTVKFEDSSPDYILKPKGKLRGSVISPHLPRRESGVYWGYTVRLATCLEKVFSECPFKEGYDVKVGTSEKGVDSRKLKRPNFHHMLIVFGGVEGLEYALEDDETLMEDDVSNLFDHYVNTCPSQGSRTIRTEEAILISMQALSHFIGIE